MNDMLKSSQREKRILTRVAIWPKNWPDLSNPAILKSVLLEKKLSGYLAIFWLFLNKFAIKYFSWPNFNFLANFWLFVDILWPKLTIFLEFQKMLIFIEKNEKKLFNFMANFWLYWL